MTSCRHYHASMSVDDREKTQYDWTHGKVQIIAATIAFGMGRFISYFWSLRPLKNAAAIASETAWIDCSITYRPGLPWAMSRCPFSVNFITCNQVASIFAITAGINKPDVRFVIHYSMPKSLEGYHQVFSHSKMTCENERKKGAKPWLHIC